MLDTTQEIARSVDDRAAPLPPGTPLLHGQYLVAEHLASGGFAAVYVALDSLDRPVVVKECCPESLCRRDGARIVPARPDRAAEFEAVMDAFMIEAWHLARLAHPNVVHVQQIFEENGTAYMVLDYIRGQDLLTAVESGPDGFSFEAVRGLLPPILDALRVVHAAGVLHRDIAPDNILLDPWRGPVLIDFGSAREGAAQEMPASVLAVKDGYSPPEFYERGRTQGPASDLYALGATIHRILTGAAPAPARERVLAVAEGRGDPYAPLEGRIEGGDPAFLAAIDAALSLDPAARPQSVDAWLNLLDPTHEAPAARAGTLDATVSQLVQETNQRIHEAARAEAEATARARAAAEAAAREEAEARAARQAALAAELSSPELVGATAEDGGGSACDRAAEETGGGPPDPAPEEAGEAEVEEPGAPQAGRWRLRSLLAPFHGHGHRGSLQHS